MRFLVSLAIALVAAMSADAQCVNGRCYFAKSAPAVQYVYITATAPAVAPLTWVYSADKLYAYLYRGDVQIGAYSYSYSESNYRNFVNGAWSEPTACPTMVPADLREPGPEMVSQNGYITGVDTAKIHQRPDGATRYTHQGKTVTRAEAREMVGADPQIPDDTGKLRVTVIGTAADRAGFVTAYNAADATDVRSRTVLWEIQPDHWTVAEYGFAATGKPTVYVQTMDLDGHGAKVLHRQDNYTAGDKSIDAIRRAIKSYDATKDPDLRVTASPVITGEDVTAFAKKNSHGILAAIAIGLVAFYRRSHP